MAQSLGIGEEMIKRWTGKQALYYLDLFHEGNMRPFNELPLAIHDMPRTWKAEPLGRPYPELEGEAQLFYAALRRKKDRSQEHFLEMHRSLCVLAFIATGKVVPVAMNHRDYSLSLNGLSWCREGIDRYDLGAMNTRALTSFYSAFWRRLRRLQKWDMWLPGVPVAVSVAPGNDQFGGAGSFIMRPGQYGGPKDKGTSPEWHAYFEKWGHLSTFD